MSEESIALGLAEAGAFSPDGKLLAVTGYGPRIRVYDVVRRRDVWRRGVVSHPRALLWSAGGDALYVIGMGGRVVVLEPATGAMARRFEHATEDVDAEWSLLGDGNLAHASFGQSVEVLDGERGGVVKAWSPRGRRLTKGLLVLLGGQALSVFTDTPPKDDQSPVGPTHMHLWNLQTESEPSTTIRFTSRMFMPALTVSPDGASIALFESPFGGAPTKLTLVDVQSGSASAGPDLDLGQGPVLRAAWSPDGDRVAVVLNEGVAVLDTANWQTTKRLQAQYPQHVAWAPNGDWLFVGGSSAFLVEATGDLAALPSFPAWKDEDGLAALMELDARGEIDADAMLSSVESAVVKSAVRAHLDEPADVARLPAPLRAVLLSSYWESSVTWDGVPTAAENLGAYLPGIADAYRTLGLDSVAAAFEKLSASLPRLLAEEEREGIFPASAPFTAIEAELEAAGLARAPDQRIELIRKHRTEFARLK